MSATAFGICKYCGQTLMVEPSEDMSEEEAAVMKCDCEPAHQHRVRKAYDAQVDEVLGSGAVELGFYDSTTQKVIDLAITAGHAVINGDVASVTISITDTDKVKIQMRKGMVKPLRREIRER